MSSSYLETPELDSTDPSTLRRINKAYDETVEFMHHHCSEDKWELVSFAALDTINLLIEGNREAAKQSAILNFQHMIDKGFVPDSTKKINLDKLAETLLSLNQFA